MTSPAAVTVGSTEAVTLTARLRSMRRMEAKPRPGSTTATELKGTSPPSGGADAHVLEGRRASGARRGGSGPWTRMSSRPRWDALRLLAVEGLAHLPAEVLERQAEGPRRRA